MLLQFQLSRLEAESLASECLVLTVREWEVCILIFKHQVVLGSSKHSFLEANGVLCTREFQHLLCAHVPLPHCFANKSMSRLDDKLM